MNTELFQSVYNDISDSLNDIYTKRNRTFFFQKIMWAITGLYLLLMLLSMLQVYFPTPGLGFLDTFLATDQNPYATLYPVVILVVILYPTTYYFTRAFKKFKEKENATITHMVRLLFPNVEFAQDMAAPGNEIANSKIFAWVNQSTRMANYGQIRSATGTAVVNIADIGIIEENPVNKLVKV